MTAEQLCALHGCRIVHFMYHDRGAFGGSIVAIGTLYLWLAAVPLRAGEPWAWWALLASGGVGFASFLTYLGYGYLDTWHGTATLALLPCFAWGMVLTRRTLRPPRHARALLRPAERAAWSSRYGGRPGVPAADGRGPRRGRAGYHDRRDDQRVRPAGPGVHGPGPRPDLRAINPRLIPLIAHDRAGFGGGLCATGVTVAACAWCGRPSRALWQVLLVSGTVGFGTAIGVHPLVGYNDATHLAPP
jgi:hypothetical protein